MAEPSFLSFGDTPHRTDSRWVEAVRWLGQLQNLPGADPANNPKRQDSYNTILHKIAAATHDSSSACVAPAAPTNLTIFGSGNAADWQWDYGTDPALDFILEWGPNQGGPYIYSDTDLATSRAHGTLNPDEGAMYGVVIARTSVSCVSDPSNEVQFTVT